MDGVFRDTELRVVVEVEAGAEVSGVRVPDLERRAWLVLGVGMMRSMRQVIMRGMRIPGVRYRGMVGEAISLLGIGWWGIDMSPVF